LKLFFSLLNSNLERLLIFILTKPLYRARVTQETVFVTCNQPSTGAIFGVTIRTGKVLHFQFNGQAISFPMADAAPLVAISGGGGVLRLPATIHRFQQILTEPGI
jgi:hypothetical protein